EDEVAGDGAEEAGNRGTPKDVLLALSGFGGEEVLNRLAGNPGSPAAALREVAYRGDHEALYLLLSRERVARSVMNEVAARLLEDTSPPRLLVQAFAEHPSAPEEVLWHMVERDRRYGLSAHVALNPSASEELLVWVAERGGYTARDALLSRPDLPVAVLEVLSRDADENIRLGAEAFVAQQPVNRNPYFATDLVKFGVSSADDLRPRGAELDEGAGLQVLRRAQESSLGPLGAFLLVT